MKKIIGIILSLSVLVSTVIFPLQVSAANLKSGEKVSGYLSGSANKYEIIIKEKGTLTISINAVAEKSGLFYDSMSKLWITLSDTNDNRIVPVQANATKGIADVRTKDASLQPRKNTNEASGTFSYNVTKGTYYISLSTSPNEDVNYVMMITDSSASSNTTTQTTAALMTMTLKSGSVLQLGTALPADNTSAVTWSTNNKEVATVSSNGKVTAVAKGSATITATAGKTALRIRVIVS